MFLYPKREHMFCGYIFASFDLALHRPPDTQNYLQMTDDRWDTDDLSLKEDNSGWRQRLERSIIFAVDMKR